MNGPLSSNAIRGKGAGQHAQAECPGEDVHAGPRGEQGDDDLNGEREVEGKQVAHQGRKTQWGRLPIEGERQAECAIRIPERQSPVVNLGPYLGCPRNQGVQLVQGVARVVYPRTAGERRRQNGERGSNDPRQAEYVRANASPGTPPCACG